MVAETGVIYTLYEGLNWNQAKSRCEALGQRLAILDTVGKTKCTANTRKVSTGTLSCSPHILNSLKLSITCQSGHLADRLFALRTMGFWRGRSDRFNIGLTRNVPSLLTIHMNNSKWLSFIGVPSLFSTLTITVKVKAILHLLLSFQILILVNSTSYSGFEPWIGFHDPEENSNFVWLSGIPMSNLQIGSGLLVQFRSVCKQ